MPAKQATRWMAPATPVFAGAPAPTGMAHSFGWRGSCGSGHVLVKYFRTPVTVIKPPAAP